MSQKLSPMPPTASPAGIGDSDEAQGDKILEAGGLLAGVGSFGLIWLSKNLIVNDTFGPLVDFVAKGEPITQSVLPLVGLEHEISMLETCPSRVLELPTVAVASEQGDAGKLNFTLFWNAKRDCPMALAYKSAAQTEVELELSKQIRARLMAEAEVTQKSKELARANADLEAFAAIISHDLKAPLRHMRHLSDVAVDNVRSGNDSALLGTLQSIETQSRRMSDMLTALLDYSTLGRKNDGIERIETRKMIESICASLPESGHTISVEGEWPVLVGLRAPLDLVLRNLVSNALQHHDRIDGHIAVRCEEQSQALILTVADDGPGIDPVHHAAIFLPFRTATPGRECNSTGMGLAAVKRAVEGAGGSITVKSAPATTRGSIFEVIWPKAVRD